MEIVYGFREDIRNDLLGNSPVIRAKHYRPSMTLDDLENKFSNGLT